MTATASTATEQLVDDLRQAAAEYAALAGVHLAVDGRWQPGAPDTLVFVMTTPATEIVDGRYAGECRTVSVAVHSEEMKLGREKVTRHFRDRWCSAMTALWELANKDIIERHCEAVTRAILAERSVPQGG